jgi:hypothetical protein
MELLVLLFLAGFILWLVAIIDLIRASEMESVSRMILALVVIFMPPVGVLLWLMVRQGALGVVLAAAMMAVTVAVVVGVLSSGSFHVSVGQNSSVSPQVQTVQQSVQRGLALPSP